MAVSYDRLWHILIDKHWSKTKLIKEAKISTNAMAKMGKGQDVSTESLRKICNVLHCGISDIVEFIDEDGTVEVLEVNGETTGIDGVTDSSDEAVISQFVTVDGKASTTPVKGLNIVKSTLKNGKTSTKKVVY